MTSFVNRCFVFEYVFSPHSQMPLSIAFVPTPDQRGMEFSCTITLRTTSEDGQGQILLERSLTGQWL